MAIVILLASGLYYFYIFKTNQTKIAASPSPSVTVKTSPSPGLSASPSVLASVPADWKTFISTKYSYSVKYPSDWIAQDLSGDAGFRKIGDETNSIVVVVTSIANTKFKTIDEWAQGLESAGTIKNPAQKTIFAGQPAYEYIEQGSFKPYEYSIDLVKGNYLYGLSFETNTSNFSEIKSSFPEMLILSTFQFIP